MICYNLQIAPLPTYAKKALAVHSVPICMGYSHSHTVWGHETDGANCGYWSACMCVHIHMYTYICATVCIPHGQCKHSVLCWCLFWIWIFADCQLNRLFLNIFPYLYSSYFLFSLTFWLFVFVSGHCHILAGMNVVLQIENFFFLLSVLNVLHITLLVVCVPLIIIKYI